jgi:hypothetical protein
MEEDKAATTKAEQEAATYRYSSQRTSAIRQFLGAISKKTSYRIKEGCLVVHQKLVSSRIILEKENNK